MHPTWEWLTEDSSTAEPLSLKALFQPQRDERSIRLQRLCCVEVPGTIEGKGNSVVAGLGGGQRLAEAFSDPKGVPLILRLNPQDSQSKFVPARYQKSAGLLFRIRKYKSGRIAARVEGFVEQVYKFVALCDYMLAPPDASRFPMDIVATLEKLRIQVAEITDKSPEIPNLDSPDEAELAMRPMEWFTEFIPPPLYTRQISAFNYRYQDNVFLTSARYYALPEEGARDVQDAFDTKAILKAVQDGIPEPLETEDEASEPFLPVPRGRGGPFNTTARIEDLILPTRGDSVADCSSRADDDLMTEVRNLFEKRPLWQRVSLLDQLAQHVTVWRIKPVLARLCFNWKNGPWRGCLCRFGYDPRKDAAARFFQSIDFRDTHFRTVRRRTQQTHGRPTMMEDPVLDVIEEPSNSLTGRRATGPSSGPSARPGILVSSTDYRFIEPPARPSQFYQLCDIEDTIIQEVIKKAPVRSTCSPRTGWFDDELLTTVREMLGAKARLMRKEAEGS